MIPPSLYQAIYINLLFILTIIYVLSHQNLSFQAIYRGRDNYQASVILSIILILFLGLRPVSYHFGDTVNYALTYSNLQYRVIEFDPETSDWLFSWIMDRCARVMSVNAFFLIIEIGYIGCIDLLRIYTETLFTMLIVNTNYFSNSESIAIPDSTFFTLTTSLIQLADQI